MSQQARFVGFSLTKVEMCGGVCGFVVCVIFLRNFGWVLFGGL